MGMFPGALVLVSTVAFSSLAACSSSSSTASSSGSGEMDAGPTPPGQPRSFKRDVVPIFAAFCASPSCHGDPNSTRVGIHLLVNDTDAVYTELQRESPTAKGAKLVVPGNPAKSFLFAKINGDEGDFDSMCTVPACGENMPPGSKIPSMDRDTVSQWITEGAMKN